MPGRFSLEMRGVEREKTNHHSFSLSQAADVLGIAPETLEVWAVGGLLSGAPAPGESRRYPLGELMRLAADQDLAARVPDGLGLRILIVDDEESLTHFLSEALEGLREVGSTAVANTGFEAGRLLNRFDPDVVLLDIRMPGVDGLDVCRTIKTDDRLKGVRVIAMTGYASQQSLKAIVQAGAERCLEKPFDIGELRAALGLGRH